MKVKLLLFGEAVNIPETSLGLGIGLVSVWTTNADGFTNGFTSASNDLGSLGFIFLETPTVDIGELDSQREAIFSNLHGRVVAFEITPHTFAISGGIARIAMIVSFAESGALTDKKIEFLAEGCKGVSLVSNTLKVSTEMLQMEGNLAQLDPDNLVSDEDIVSISDAAPQDDQPTV